MGAEFVTVYGDDYLFEQGAQQLFSIAIRRRRRDPDTLKIDAESINAVTLIGTQGLGVQSALAGQFGLRLGEFAQALFPLGLQAASDKPVLRVDRAICLLYTSRCV